VSSKPGAGHYRFCNDKEIFETLDKRISEMIGPFIGVYSDATRKYGYEARRALLGVGKLTEIDFEPFAWPKSANAGQVKAHGVEMTLASI
jgi:hypothetical protein